MEAHAFHQSCLRQSDAHVCPDCAHDVQVYIEGPYGSPHIDTFGDHFKVYLIITTGFGWTFLRAWKRQIVQVRRLHGPADIA